MGKKIWKKPINCIVVYYAKLVYGEVQQVSTINVAVVLLGRLRRHKIHTNVSVGFLHYFLTLYFLHFV